jgi:hypothetical protein
MLLLQGSYGTSGVSLCNEEESTAESIAKEIDMIARNFLNHADTYRVNKVSPFIHHLLYQSCVIFSEKYRRTASQSAYEAANTIQHMMGILGDRWKAGGKDYALLKIPQTIVARIADLAYRGLS